MPCSYSPQMQDRLSSLALLWLSWCPSPFLHKTREKSEERERRSERQRVRKKREVGEPTRRKGEKMRGGGEEKKERE